MFDCLIFSKNRCLQLDGCIRSIRLNFPQIKLIHVLYQWTNNNFSFGYEKLLHKYPDIKWKREDNFRIDYLNIVNNDFKNTYCIHFVDDDIGINKINDTELNQILQSFTDNVSGISLRHNPNITYCGSADIVMNILPEFLRRDKYLLWDWTKYDSRYEWGYPHALNSNIYKTEEFKKLVNSLNFYHPNSLEGEMNNHRNYNKPYICSFLKSIFFNVANNFVKSQQSIANDYIHSIENLNKLFLEGMIIDFRPLQEMKYDRVHGPLPYTLMKE